MTDQLENKSNPKLYTATKWPHSWPPPGGMRHLIFHAKKNGFDKVIKRVGRRVLIDEAAFFRWVEERNAKGGLV